MLICIYGIFIVTTCISICKHESNFVVAFLYVFIVINSVAVGLRAKLECEGA